jgi:hypothetical protein
MELTKIFSSDRQHQRQVANNSEIKERILREQTSDAVCFINNWEIKHTFCAVRNEGNKKKQSFFSSSAMGHLQKFSPTTAKKEIKNRELLQNNHYGLSLHIGFFLLYASFASSNEI